MVILQPYAYTTQIRKIPLPESQAKTFYTDLNHSRTNLMSETYLTLPCLPSRPIGPEPFQYLCGSESLLAAICLLIRLCKFTLRLWV